MIQAHCRHRQVLWETQYPDVLLLLANLLLDPHIKKTVARKKYHSYKNKNNNVSDYKPSSSSDESIPEDNKKVQSPLEKQPT